MIRLGKQNDKPKPIRIEFESTDAVFSLLKTKKRLSQLQEWKDLWITTDLTPYHRGVLLAIKKERDQRNSLLEEKIWFVKFIHGYIHKYPI